MKKIFLLILFFTVISFSGYSKNGDTLVVQAVTFADSSPVGWGAHYKTWVKFPENTGQFSKIIMVQTLKCDQATKADTFPCGEWDYIWQTMINVPKGDTVEPYCIGSFVTPYGKRLKLGGEKGWQWEYDITDYAPILSGKKEIITGNNQELLDLKFLFIKGIPTRRVISVENIYPFGDYKYEYLADDSILKKKQIILNPDAKGYMLKAIISGHGHNGPRNCCEWESKTHSYYINDEMAFRWNVWKDCGFNPIYPQGGTWPFDRAGWCPGTKVDEYTFELTPKVHPGDTIMFDYGIEHYCDNGEKGGDFRMAHQLFTFGPLNFGNDAALVEIVTPTSKDEYSRINPICSNPMIIIENSGKNPIYSMEIEYGLTNSTPSTYKWAGHLETFDKADIELPVPSWKELKTNQNFYVKIKTVNGSEDENLQNNILYSVAPLPVVLPEKFIIHLITNNLGRPSENRCMVMDADGKLLYNFDNYADSTEYFHQISLTQGCYRFRFTDKMQDGIMRQWWYYYDNKSLVGNSGKIEILSEDKSTVLVNFPNDFGQELLLNFVVGEIK